MKSGTKACAVILAIFACQVLVTDAFTLRSRQRNEVHDHASQRIAMMKTMPPFDMNPGTFLGLVAAVPTDSLLLFFSPTCPDCEKLAPMWSRVTSMFEDNQDLTILSVSDDAGTAPAPYTHDENPTIFFIPKGAAASPVIFPMSYLHEFVALPETGNTDDSIVNRIVTFTRSHLTMLPKSASAVAAPAVPAAVVESTPSALSAADSGALTARLLASLAAKQSQPVDEQMKIVLEPHYAALPVVEFLKSVSGTPGPPLVKVAATYLDGLPLAQQWANQYATQQISNYRQTGWNPTDPAEVDAYAQKLLDYAIPLYARSIYFQRGLKG